MLQTYPALLDASTVDALASPVAILLREAFDPVRDALDGALRTLAAHAERMAHGPFGTAALHRAALEAPFEPSLDAVAPDAEGLPMLFGRPLAEGSAWAVQVFGIDAVARLASALAGVLPLGTVSAARIPGIAAAVLLAGWAKAIREDGRDAAGLGALLIETPPLRTASLLTLRIATAAGLPIAPMPFGQPR